MFKKFTVIILCAFMMLSLASCGVRQSLDEKIAEKVTEGVIDKATGGEADIDIDKGELTMKGENGETITFGDKKWPEGNAADLIPEFKKGTIISAINSDKACMIILEEVEAKDFSKYVEELKDQGFTNDVAEYTSDSGLSYSACSNDNNTIVVLYELEGKTLTINLETSQQED